MRDPGSLWCASLTGGDSARPPNQTKAESVFCFRYAPLLTSPHPLRVCDNVRRCKNYKMFVSCREGDWKVEEQNGRVLSKHRTQNEATARNERSPSATTASSTFTATMPGFERRTHSATTPTRRRADENAGTRHDARGARTLRAQAGSVSRRRAGAGGLGNRSTPPKATSKCVDTGVCSAGSAPHQNQHACNQRKRRHNNPATGR